MFPNNYYIIYNLYLKPSRFCFSPNWNSDVPKHLNVFLNTFFSEHSKFFTSNSIFFSFRLIQNSSVMKIILEQLLNEGNLQELFQGNEISPLVSLRAILEYNFACMHETFENMLVILSKVYQYNLIPMTFVKCWTVSITIKKPKLFLVGSKISKTHWANSCQLKTNKKYNKPEKLISDCNRCTTCFQVLRFFWV